MSDQLAFFSEPRARRRDPDTSRDAAAKVEPGAQKLERRILQGFAINGPLTDEELAAWVAERKPGSVITARSRLKNLGLVEASKTKRKNAGGFDMQVWRITKEGYDYLRRLP